MNDTKNDTKKMFDQTQYDGNQKIIIWGRETLELQGVLKVNDFDKKKIHLTTLLGDLIITGEELHIAHLLLDQEQLAVSGKLNAVCFDDAKGGKGKKKSAGFLERLTK